MSESSEEGECDTCGENPAEVLCTACPGNSRLCMSCDELVHRHKKRRHHTRQPYCMDVPNKRYNILCSASLI